MCKGDASIKFTPSRFRLPLAIMSFHKTQGEKGLRLIRGLIGQSGCRNQKLIGVVVLALLCTAIAIKLDIGKNLDSWLRG